VVDSKSNHEFCNSFQVYRPNEIIRGTDSAIYWKKWSVKR
jgi:hypothetical protein